MVPCVCSSLLAIASSNALTSPLLSLPDQALNLTRVALSPDHAQDGTGHEVPDIGDHADQPDAAGNQQRDSEGWE